MRDESLVGAVEGALVRFVDGVEHARVSLTAAEGRAVGHTRRTAKGDGITHLVALSRRSWDDDALRVFVCSREVLPCVVDFTARAVTWLFPAWAAAGYDGKAVPMFGASELAPDRMVGQLLSGGDLVVFGTHERHPPPPRSALSTRADGDLIVGLPRTRVVMISEVPSYFADHEPEVGCGGSGAGALRLFDLDDSGSAAGARVCFTLRDCRGALAAVALPGGEDCVVVSSGSYETMMVQIFNVEEQTLLRRFALDTSPRSASATQRAAGRSTAEAARRRPCRCLRTGRLLFRCSGTGWPRRVILPCVVCRCPARSCVSQCRQQHSLRTSWTELAALVSLATSSLAVPPWPSIRRGPQC